MIQTLKIEVEVPDGKTAVWRDGKVVYEDTTKLPETWEEFCHLYPIKNREYYITSSSGICVSSYGTRLHNDDKNSLPSSEAAEAHLALMQLHKLRDCYRQGWLPDWEDGVSDKYCIEFATNRYTIFIQNRCSRFLSFQSQEIAEKFLENFKDLIEQAGELI